MDQKAELQAILGACKQHFILAGIFSAAVNFLMLTPIIYMLTVYDRVVTSGSLSTLGMLTLLMVCLLLASGGFEWVRATILIHASNRLENLLRSRVSDATFQGKLVGANIGGQPMADLTGLRQFLTGNGLFAFFDAPWFPIYIAVMFLFHPWFGVAGILAGVAMVALAYANETSTNKLIKDANGLSSAATAQFESSLRNAEVVAAMGMKENIRKRQDNLFTSVLGKQESASKRAAIFAAVSKSFRIISQSLVLGLGAYLALNQQISPGMMIAGSLLLGRALAPIDMLVGTWKGFSVARAQYDRLSKLLAAVPKAKESMNLPDPEGQLSVEQISVIPPGSRATVLSNISFNLSPGEALGIVGPSGSGKSSLARTLLGIWPAVAGKVRLDGANIYAWDREALGPHIGYLPQDIELFEGTISENIARFQQTDSNDIVDAAKLADVHEMILRLPQGYDTQIGSSSGMISGGQRQRIGLARAVFRAPKLLILDEPNSNLDDEGEKSLVEAVRRIKEQGSTVIVITHRSMILQVVEKMLVLKDGKLASFGPRDQVIRQLMGNQAEAKSAAS